MLKAKEYNVADSNIANLGSDLEKKVRLAAAETEQAWKNAGKKNGILIWRIEKFKVVAWPTDRYGEFFSGDSYILLRTYTKPDAPKLLWDLHFWLGKHTTQDEAGTAAYKTVELDDFLGTEPVQHREVQEHESDLWMSYWDPKSDKYCLQQSGRNGMTILEGGVDTGFKHVEPEKYRPRLLHIKGQKKVRVTEVEMSYKSLNSGDVFVVDAGLALFQFNGKKCGMMEKQKGAQLTKALKDQRKGAPKVYIIEEGTKGDDVTDFWKILGGEGPVKSAEEGGSDKDADSDNNKIRKLFRLSDATGKMEFTLVAEGTKIKKEMLDTSDVFIFDAGNEVFAWIGKGTTTDERKSALGYAQTYLTNYKRPAWLPITRVLEGSDHASFHDAFR